MTRVAPPLLAALLCSTAVASHDRVTTRVTWQEDVSRVIDARCVTCHAGKPVDLSGYATARPWARAIRDAILDGHGYSAGNGAALTPFERELLVQWIDGSAPERAKFNPVEYPRLPARYTRLASARPLETLDAYQARLGGTRAIVPGLGLALRTSDHLFVVDRGPGAERIVARGTVVPSLAAHLAALHAAVSRTRISDAAYVIGPNRADGEPRVEVAEIAPEGPDRFWCSMHPGERSPAPGTCPRCRMALVAMPPMSLDAFTLEVAGMSSEDDATGLRLRVTRGAARAPVTQFLTRHERPFHLFVVDEALEHFAHLHPEVRGDEWHVDVQPPASGAYRLIADVAPADAMPQLRMTPVSFERRAVAAPEAPPPTIAGRLGAGFLRAGREGRLVFELRDRRTDASPDDLEPYLGAAAHLFVIDRELRDPMHAHPIDVPSGGLAAPAFDVRFPRAGRYVMWLQVQRAGRVETLRFTVEVSK